MVIKREPILNAGRDRSWWRAVCALGGDQELGINKRSTLAAREKRCTLFSALMPSK